MRKFFVARAFNGKHLIPLKSNSKIESTNKIENNQKLRRQSMPAHISNPDNIVKPFTRRSLNGRNIKDTDSDSSMSPVIPLQIKTQRKRKSKFERIYNYMAYFLSIFY